MQGKMMIVIAGMVVGALGVGLVLVGNPANMGFCIACFLRDMTGALGLHTAAKVQYLRPEILGIVIGAFVAALATREFRVLGGASTLTRFVLGFLAMIGFLVFLGCPLRMALRLAAGDWNALTGLVGLIAGVGLGVFFIGRGFSLGPAKPIPRANGYVFPLTIAAILIIFLAAPAVFFASQEGPGAQYAPVVLSLLGGLLVGVLAQRSRLCMVGGVRDFIMFRDSYLLIGLVVIIATAFAGNLIFGKFNPGFLEQPLAHNDGLYNFLGMTLAGLASTLIGGCPLRQLVSASEGNTDSAVTVLGLMAGAAFAQNFQLAADPTGVPVGGQYAVWIGLAVVIAIGFAFSLVKTTVRGRAANGQAVR